MEKLTRQEIKNEVRAYIRKRGENVSDYDIDAIADELADMDWGEVDNRERFERTVYENHIVD